MVIARTAARANTEMLQDKPLKHPARPAARGNTGLVQDKQPNHRARAAPQTRTRLLRAVLKPLARAMQATVATPTQEHVQLVLEGSTRLRRDQFFVLIAGQGRILKQ